MLAHYDATTETVRERFDYLVHDLYFAGPVRAHARDQAAVAPVWMYHFTRVPPTPWGEALGAHHAAELVYVFGTLTTSDEPGERPLGLSPLGDFTEVDTGLSETMRAYWIRFAAAGDPNGPGLPAWPAWDGASDRYLELGVDVSAGDGLHVEGAALWDRFQARAPRGTVARGEPRVARTWTRRGFSATGSRSRRCPAVATGGGRLRRSGAELRSSGPRRVAASRARDDFVCRLNEAVRANCGRCGRARAALVGVWRLAGAGASDAASPGGRLAACTGPDEC